MQNKFICGFRMTQAASSLSNYPSAVICNLSIGEDMVNKQNHLVHFDDVRTNTANCRSE